MEYTVHWGNEIVSMVSHLIALVGPEGKIIKVEPCEETKSIFANMVCFDEVDMVPAADDRDEETDPRRGGDTGKSSNSFSWGLVDANNKENNNTVAISRAKRIAIWKGIGMETVERLKMLGEGLKNNKMES